MKKVRIIYKVTNVLNGQYYIGKCCIPKERDKNFKYYIICPTIETLSTEWFKTDIDNLLFEILEYDIENIFMEDVLDKYLKNENNSNNLIYEKQKEFIKTRK